MMPKVKLVLITIVATTVYYGLAVLGLGGFRTFFSHSSLIALTVVGLIMLVVALFSPGNISSGEREDKSNRWVLGAFTIIGLLTAYLPAYTDRIGLWTIGGDTIRWLGVVLSTIGGVLRIYPVFVLGRRFSGLVAIQPGHTLVTNGIYGVIRNPSYLGMIIMLLGWSFAFRSIVGVLITVLTIPILIARIHAEEKLLRSYFDSEYDTYCTHTWRLVPWLY